MIRRPKSSESSRQGNSKGVSGVVYHTPPPNSHSRPNWMCLQDIPDESCCEEVTNSLENEEVKSSNIWDGNKKLFVQLLDDMDNIGGVDGLSDGSARRRKKARELFTDWLFRSKKPESPLTQGPQLRHVHNNSLHSHRFSGDFTNYDVQIPVAESPKAMPGRLERQAPSRRSCGIIGDRKHLYSNWRHSSIHISNEDEADSGYHSGNSAILGTVVGEPRRPPGEMTLSRQDLKRRIEKFNATNTHGLLMEMPQERSTFFEGFIRVHMNLIRPINMRVCDTPPTFVSTLKRNKKKKAAVQDHPSNNTNNHKTNNHNNNNTSNHINNHTSNSSSHANMNNPVKSSGNDGKTDTEGRGREDEEEKHSVISFSLPKNTSKVIHINSSTKTSEVVSVLLSKFNISDNPRKFSLYERIELPGNKPSMRKMLPDEQPLMMCLVWGDVGDLDHHRFVLQENDVGEIVWEAFSLPELESFLSVLEREEGECVRQVRDKFHLHKIQLARRLDEVAGQSVRRGGGGGGGRGSQKAVWFSGDECRSSKFRDESSKSPENDDDTTTFSSTRSATIKSNLHYHPLKQHHSLDSAADSIKSSTSRDAGNGVDMTTLKSALRRCKVEDV